MIVLRNSLIFIGLIVFTSNTRAELSINHTNNPIGGGENYSNLIHPNDATYFIKYNVNLSEKEKEDDVKEQLLKILPSANWGDIIYIADDVKIDLTGKWNITVPPGVTLASGRGREGSLGALLMTTERAKKPLFEITGSHTRITGLRLQGPTVISDFDEQCEMDEATGISAENGGETALFSHIQIDNNEMWAWPHRAINVTGTLDAHIHHNHIHHNRRHENDSGCGSHGLGYGVSASSGSSLIEANLFNHNRHDIASTGLPGSSYEARYNVVVEGSMDHNFDVHGCQDRPTHTDCREAPFLSGEFISVHHNTFWDKGDNAVVIRGIPSQGGEVHDNRFRQKVEFSGPSNPDGDSAIFQRYALGNLTYWNNELDVSVSPGWFISHSGKEFWKLRTLSSYDPKAFSSGDFDGDGAHDIFRVNGSKWLVSFQGKQDWQQWNEMPISAQKLGFGDFNGDEKTDVFMTNGSAWYVSWSGQSNWSLLNSSSIQINDLRFGDFNGDDETDVWYSNGNQWFVSWSGVSNWFPLSSSSFPTSDLHFADFDGDNKTDIFRTSGQKWYVSWGGNTPWEELANSTVTLKNLYFCDFDGDGSTDVVRDSTPNASESYWKVSFGAQTSWQDLRVFRNAPQRPSDEFISISQTSLADFNGDGKCDVLAHRAF
ncbi:VCBS repeat-containing protein [Microbulbifer sp. ALW1]|uniref:FG-GAP repeat domain-containing protein n=1 Tax=Microbulbifer sp. (strain ALW1) TaxID=1516059 RepID=UPI0013591623|nr:VCBS repeat-containing protein [Microbulbifer sp. ALW1]